MGEVCPYCKESLKILQENVYEIGFNCSVSKIFAAFSYEGGIREAIHRLKFNDNPHVASVLVDLSFPILKKYLYSYKPYVSQSPIQDSLIIDGRKMIVKEQKEICNEQSPIFFSEQRLIIKPNYDIIIPTPLHRTRKRERGYNQSELLASRLAFYLKIPMLKNVLVKKVNTAPQSTLGRGERLKNLIGAFQVNNSNLIEGNRILLVDDITTTGSTLEKCAEVLLNAGAAHIDAYVIAMRPRL
ncbi:MAG: ComF family protein [Clostridiaceae bacterium]|jgi:ComF family protein|nr:ComF family protein [Clostridiaceae bacterium]